MVSDWHEGRGIGPELVRRLIDIARGREKMEKIRADVLADNAVMPATSRRQLRTHVVDEQSDHFGRIAVVTSCQPLTQARAAGFPTVVPGPGIADPFDTLEIQQCNAVSSRQDYPIPRSLDCAGRRRQMDAAVPGLIEV